MLVSDDVFRRLTDDILSGRYEPGEKLPTQRKLAADLGVNMAPVREAVKRLEQLRLVEVRHGDAMRVADWRTAGGLDVVAHLLFRAGGLDRGTLDALMEARAADALRGRAAGRHPPHATTRRASCTTWRPASPQAPDTPTAQALDWAFFATVVEAADNLVLGLVMNSIRQIYLEQRRAVRGRGRPPRGARAAVRATPPRRSPSATRTQRPRQFASSPTRRRSACR